MMPPLIYRFYGPKAEIFNGNIILIDLKGDDMSKEMLEFGLDNDTFVGLDEDRLTLDGVGTEMIRILDMPYSVRKPTPEVRNDWSKSKFTIDEAQLLNKLQIKPSILSSYIFQGDGYGMLVKFLANLVNSKCYTDKDLLTKEECSVSEEFIDKIYSYLLEHDPRIDEGIQTKKNQQMRMEAQLRQDGDVDAHKKLSEEELQRAKDELKAFKEQFGLDDSVTEESLCKSPYKDEVLVEYDNSDDPTFNKPFLDVQAGKYENKYYMFIGSMKRTSKCDNEEELEAGDFKLARLYVDVKKEDEVSDAVDTEIIRLSQEYPGWEFFKELGENESDTGSPAEDTA
jgi:hypothetical protein